MASDGFKEFKDLRKDLSIFAKEAPNVVKTIMAAFANDAIEGMRKNLSNHGIDSGSNLSQSIKPLPIEITEDSIIMTIEMPDYWDYVNQGVDGLQTKWGSEYMFRPTAKVPIYPNRPNFVTKLADWAYKKGINTFTFKNQKGEFVTKPISSREDLERLGFAIMKGVKKNGRKPTHFVDDYFTDNKIDELTDELFIELSKQLRD